MSSSGRNQLIRSGIFIIFAVFIFNAGCAEPPVKDPMVTVSDIELSDVTSPAMRVNVTVVIFNSNPVGATLNNVTFDVSYADDAENYPGHGEQTNIDEISSGSTTVIITVIGYIPAVRTAATLLRKGSGTLNVNGSAFIDVRVTSFEKRFEQSREFRARDFGSLVPATTISGTMVHSTDKLQQSGGLTGYCHDNKIFLILPSGAATVLSLPPSDNRRNCEGDSLCADAFISPVFLVFATAGPGAAVTVS